MIIDDFVKAENKLSGMRQLGFQYVYKYLGKSEIITNYFANEFLWEIFYGRDDMTLEDIVHNNCSCLDKLNKMGIDNLILYYIKYYDECLYDYVLCHSELIVNIKKDITGIIRNWDKYEKDMLYRKNCIFEQEVNDFIQKYDAKFDYLEVCAYIDRNLNLPVKLYNEEVPDYSFIDINKISLVEYNCLNKIIKLAKDLYMNTIIDKNYYNKEENGVNINKTKILQFKKNDI